MGITVKINTAGLGQGLIDRAKVAAAMNRANETVQSLAEQLAPVSATGSHGNPPGFLRDNITITKEATAEDLSTKTTSAATYSGAVELGFVHAGSGEAISAQPFLSPAYEAGKQQLLE